ncbi:hypothetical protein BDZ89DRAFT_1048581 [Hymenopellis radicata]|nr:hypothetical protein BDZ89DRAFT_1048581 [Hymenopellis radicata]
MAAVDDRQSARSELMRERARDLNENAISGRAFGGLTVVNRRHLTVVSGIDCLDGACTYVLCAKSSWGRGWAYVQDMGYHADLLANPELLTARSSPSEPITALDGRYGAILPHAPAIITTPNASWLPLPPRAATQIVQRRADFRYGPEDPILFPQMAVYEAPHLPCILRYRPPSDLGSELDSLWVDPMPVIDWVEDLTFRRGFGRASTIFSSRLVSGFAYLRSCFETGSLNAGIMAIYNTEAAKLSLISANLRFLHQPFGRFSLLLRDYQRTALELLAIYAYHTIVEPARRGVTSLLTEKPDLHDDFMGCITYDLALVNLYMRVGVPVWLIRPTEDLGSVRVDELRTLMDPRYSTVTAICPQFPDVLWEGDASSNEKYACLRRAAERSQGNFRSPMTMPFFAVARPTVPLPSASTSTRPTASRAKGKGKGNTVTKKLVYPVHALLPPISPAWLAAAESIDEESYACSEKPAEQYFLPQPQMFTNVGQPAKSLEMLQKWLRIRPVAIGVAQSNSPHVMSHQAWREWINACVVRLPDVKDMSRHGWRHQAWKEEVDKLVTAAETEMTVELLEVGMWNGRPLTSTTTENGKRDVLEIVWEANELAFRMELASLCLHLCRPEHVDSRKFMQAVSLCFPLGDAPLGLVDLGQANQGLADPDWWSRARFVYALKKVMDLWRISSPYPAPDSDVQFGKTGFTREEMEAFTATIFAHYIGNFFQVFGRPPRLPMNLPFQPQTSWVPPVYVNQRGKADRWVPRL